MSDLISRQAAVDALNEQIEQCNKALGSFDISLKDEFAIKVERASLKAYREQLENLPTVQPKHGKWKNGKCDQCSGSAPFWPLANTYYCSNFCPHCGADMRTKETDCDYERAVEQLEHDMLYEPTFNPDDGSM